MVDRIRRALKSKRPGPVASDHRSCAAVARLVHKSRKEVMAASISGVIIDDWEGSMIKLAKSRSLLRSINRHKIRLIQSFIWTSIRLSASVRVSDSRTACHA